MTTGGLTCQATSARASRATTGRTTAPHPPPPPRSRCAVGYWLELRRRAGAQAALSVPGAWSGRGARSRTLTTLLRAWQPMGPRTATHGWSPPPSRKRRKRVELCPCTEYQPVAASGEGKGPDTNTDGKDGDR